MPRVRPTVPRRVRPSLPIFSLYGEASVPQPAMLHIETVQSRSSLYDWEIDTHVHQGLHQVVWLRAGPVEAVLDETRTSAQGPVLIVIPPGVVHAFRFSPESDGHVLTLDATRLAEGDAQDAGSALQRLHQLLGQSGTGVGNHATILFYLVMDNLSLIEIKWDSQRC